MADKLAEAAPAPPKRLDASSIGSALKSASEEPQQAAQSGAPHGSRPPALIRLPEFCSSVPGLLHRELHTITSITSADSTLYAGCIVCAPLAAGLRARYTEETKRFLCQILFCEGEGMRLLYLSGDRQELKSCYRTENLCELSRRHAPAGIGAPLGATRPQAGARPVPSRVSRAWGNLIAQTRAPPAEPQGVAAAGAAGSRPPRTWPSLARRRRMAFWPRLRS